ncbi:MAG TPA: exonuclease SbcCD subunit D [Pelolinea sp.]|nr:exonuclease SbcCD subunit D [Pelolinea sp.]
MIKLLHFADAHIDLARQGRRDAESGLPLRVLDFLKSLDTIVDAAISEQVDMAIFAGDAYRDRSPAPTYQREWGRRIMRLSEEGIQTLMVVGNHDVSPAAGRAHTLQEFETLQVPNIHVISKPVLLKPEDLNGLPIQVIGIPWLNRSGLAASLDNEEVSGEADINAQMEAQLSQVIESFLNELDPALPAILTSHVSVQGASYGNERSVMLGRDLVLSGSLVRDERLDYVALGHIHKAQNLNEGGHHPVIYPGSIERVDFGELDDRKTYVIAEVERNQTSFKQFTLPGRRFIDRAVEITKNENVQEQILELLPESGKLRDAILRLSVSYPRDWEAMIDEPAIRRAAEDAFEFHFIRRPRTQVRLRLATDESIASLPPLELLEKYWQAVPPEGTDTSELNMLSGEIIRAVEIGHSPEDEETIA